MDFDKVKMSAKQKLSFLLAAAFLLASIYSYQKDSYASLYIFGGLTTVFFIIVFSQANDLSLLKQIWMKFGVILGMILTPFVLAFIFFGIITPVAILMRLLGRDELRLRLSKRSSHWVERNTKTQTESFKKQF